MKRRITNKAIKKDFDLVFIEEGLLKRCAPERRKIKAPIPPVVKGVRPYLSSSRVYSPSELLKLGSDDSWFLFFSKVSLSPIKSVATLRSISSRVMQTGSFNSPTI